MKKGIFITAVTALLSMPYTAAETNDLSVQIDIAVKGQKTGNLEFNCKNMIKRLQKPRVSPNPDQIQDILDIEKTGFLTHTIDWYVTLAAVELSEPEILDVQRECEHRFDMAKEGMSEKLYAQLR
ncbi:hypothetical protein [Enterovibrio norvegicus]|uniref:hypothetical protein n=1 Tax=Enterovibrio norvegicus TaxID=188144 RepID=UPI000C84586F|nr:hypothetical protein [Enterovibrio norvegicus]PMH64469.1 hypothetical protein BCU62_15555 [Enterovibrio norvegicus]